MNRELTLSGEIVTINGHPVKKIYGGFGGGQPCILAKQIAELHERELMHINELINNNLDWLEEETDILNLKSVIVQNDNEKISDFLLNFYTQNALIPLRLNQFLIKIRTDDLSLEEITAEVESVRKKDTEKKDNIKPNLPAAELERQAFSGER